MSRQGEFTMRLNQIEVEMLAIAALPALNDVVWRAGVAIRVASAHGCTEENAEAAGAALAEMLLGLVRSLAGDGHRPGDKRLLDRLESEQLRARSSDTQH